MENIRHLTDGELKEYFLESFNMKLKGVTNRKLFEFNWRCVMHTLPYCVVEEEFIFKKENLQQDLYAHFTRLDTITVIVNLFLDDEDSLDIAHETNISFLATGHADVITTCSREIAQLIFDDLAAVEENKDFPPFGGVAAFGNDWHDFRIALASVGCDYWGTLYEDFFENGVNLAQLSIRFMVPEDIQAKGAAEVAKYLKKYANIEAIIKQHKQETE